MAHKYKYELKRITLEFHPQNSKKDMQWLKSVILSLLQQDWRNRQQASPRNSWPASLNYIAWQNQKTLP